MPDPPPARAAFDPKDDPLRHDVRRLGALVGGILKEQGPDGLYDRVEAVRRACIARRRDGAESGPDALLRGLDPDLAHEVARAFSTYFQAVNLAEQSHRLRRRAAYARAGEAQPGGPRAVLESLRDAGVDLAELASALDGLVVEPVVTAHPTEAVRRTLLAKELRIARALMARTEDGAAPAREQSATLAAAREELTAAWQTDEHRATRPTVADEVEHALFFLAEPMREAVPAVREGLRRALVEVYGDGAGALAELPTVRFASWIGGDMDGNPNVGAETIRATLARHSELALGRLGDEVRTLFRHLSQSRTRVGVSAALDARTAEYEALLPAAAAEIPERYASMPYRRFLWLVSARLDATAAATEHAYAEPDELVADLELVAASLAANRGRNAGLALVRDTIERARAFGFHTATLDTRQDALVHRAACAALLGDAGLAERPPAERAAAIAAALSDGRALEPGDDADARRSVDVARAVKAARERHGTRAVGLSVISMAQGPDDALAVLLIARAGGLVDSDGRVPLDVAPLFETVDDLERAPATLRALLAEPFYRAHLAARGDRQWVMLGYSDSAKTDGIVAARVALRRAQRALVGVAGEAGVSLRCFHGRGGSVSRGGAKPRDAVLATPWGALDGHLRVTEQGEIVRAKYGLEGIAERTLELLLGATLERTALDRRAGDPGPDPAERAALHDCLNDAGRAAYRALLEDPDFIEYFRSATPIDVIERLELGSRPSRRRELRGVQDLRAIPWVFAWTQSRLLLPGWYGAGAALAAATDAFGLDRLRLEARTSRWFATLLRDLEHVLAKSDLGIARRYDILAGETGERLFPGLVAEHERATEHLLAIREREALLADDETLRRAIRLRNPYVDPSSLLQVDLLARWRDKDRDDPALERALFATVHGVARGLLNTG